MFYLSTETHRAQTPWVARAEDRELAPGEPLHRELGDFIGDVAWMLDGCWVNYYVSLT